jgi:hypothetical protein
VTPEQRELIREARDRRARELNPTPCDEKAKQKVAKRNLARRIRSKLRQRSAARDEDLITYAINIDAAQYRRLLGACATYSTVNRRSHAAQIVVDISRAKGGRRAARRFWTSG